MPLFHHPLEVLHHTIDSNMKPWKQPDTTHNRSQGTHISLTVKASMLTNPTHKLCFKIQTRLSWTKSNTPLHKFQWNYSKSAAATTLKLPGQVRSQKGFRDALIRSPVWAPSKLCGFQDDPRFYEAIRGKPTWNRSALCGDIASWMMGSPLRGRWDSRSLRQDLILSRRSLTSTCKPLSRHARSSRTFFSIRGLPDDPGGQRIPPDPTRPDPLCSHAKGVQHYVWASHEDYHTFP